MFEPETVAPSVTRVFASRFSANNFVWGPAQDTKQWFHGPFHLGPSETAFYRSQWNVLMVYGTGKTQYMVWYVCGTVPWYGVVDVLYC